MLDALPASVWKDKSLTWFDPACGIGNFPIMVYYRLLKGLDKTIISDKVRSRYIIEKMLFMNELNKKNVVLCRKLFAMIDPEAKLNISNKDFLEVSGKYDIIVGNPPYNEARVKETSDQPLYSKFIVKAIEMTDKLLFVVPSRWFSGGKGLDEFRKSMLLRKDIVSINHIPNSRTIWPEVEIKGGVNYFYLDKSHNGLTEFTSDMNNKQMVKLLLDKNADVNIHNEDKIYPIHLSKNKEIIKLLLKAGADINTVDKFGANILHKTNNPKFAEFLLGMNMDVNSQNDFGQTALHIACKFEDLKMAKFLSKIADIHVKNKKGHTPLDVARSMNFTEIVKVLEKKERKTKKNQSKNNKTRKASPSM
jgi:hypothetical protein